MTWFVSNPIQNNYGQHVKLWLWIQIHLWEIGKKFSWELFILNDLWYKFLKLIFIMLNDCFLGSKPVFAHVGGTRMKEACHRWDSNQWPQDLESSTLPLEDGLVQDNQFYIIWSNYHKYFWQLIFSNIKVINFYIMRTLPGTDLECV